MNDLPSHQLLSLKGHYDHEKLCYHQKTIIPLNILKGKMAQKLISEVPHDLLDEAISEMIVEYLNGHNDILTTNEKRNHAIMTLNKIRNGKWNFVERHIEEANKFNKYYQEKIIQDIPNIQKDFKCQTCGERQFGSKAALFSHKKSCELRAKKEQNIQLGIFGSKRIKLSSEEYVPRPKNIKVQIIKIEQRNFQQQKLQQTQNNIYKRACPLNLDSIFEED